MPDPTNEPVQVSLSIDGAGPVTANCVRREVGDKDVLLLWDDKKRPVTGDRAKLIYGDEELSIHFLELDEADSAGVWEILKEGPK